MKKVIIEDLVLHHNGGEEKELNPKQAIRFETEDAKYTVEIDQYGSGISVYKVTLNGIDSIKISPQSTNKISIY